MFHNIVIAGVGMIGGSLAGSLKKACYPAELTGLVNREEDALYCKQRGLLDHCVTRIDALPDQIDLLMLATPLHVFPEIVKQVTPKLAENAVISDVGSVKQWVLDTLNPLVPDTCLLIPGHPVSGKSKSGPRASDAMLFQGKVVYLTPPPAANDHAINNMKTLWAATGADVRTIEPAAHDHIYAVVSHLPQLLSFATIAVMQRFISAEEGRSLYHASPMLQRFFRLGASSPWVWNDIFHFNFSALQAACNQWEHCFPSAIEGDFSASMLPQALAQSVGISLYRTATEENPALNLLGYIGTGFADMTVATDEKLAASGLSKAWHDALKQEVQVLLSLAGNADNTLVEKLEQLNRWHAEMAG